MSYNNDDVTLTRVTPDGNGGINAQSTDISVSKQSGGIVSDVMNMYNKNQMLWNIMGLLTALGLGWLLWKWWNDRQDKKKKEEENKCGVIATSNGSSIRAVRY